MGCMAARGVSHVAPRRNRLNVFDAADVSVSIGNTLCKLITAQNDVIRCVSTDLKATPVFLKQTITFFSVLTRSPPEGV